MKLQKNSRVKKIKLLAKKMHYLKRSIKKVDALRKKVFDLNKEEKNL